MERGNRGPSTEHLNFATQLALSNLSTGNLPVTGDNGTTNIAASYIPIGGKLVILIFGWARLLRNIPLPEKHCLILTLVDEAANSATTIRAFTGSLF